MKPRNNHLFLPLLLALASVSATSVHASKGVSRVAVHLLIDQIQRDDLDALVPLCEAEGLQEYLREGYLYAEGQTAGSLTAAYTDGVASISAWHHNGLRRFNVPFYFDKKRISSRQIAFNKLLAHASKLFLQLQGSKQLCFTERLLQSTTPLHFNELHHLNYHSDTKTDSIVEFAAVWRDANADTHEINVVRVANLPLSQIFYGFQLPAPSVDKPFCVDYIAPTLSKAMRIRAPNVCG